MATRTARSLRHEYELFIEQEIENYKESIPRSALLAIGDEAAATLASEAQFTLTELLLCEEVDRIIFRRLRLPAYTTWRRKRLKLHEEMRRPEHWGLSANDALVRTIRNAEHGAGRVLVAGDAAERSALFLAANGCDVTTIEGEEDAIERVISAAIQAGLAERVHAVAGALSEFTPDAPLRAVVFSHATLRALDPIDRERVIGVLQSATADGGVHLVQTIAAGAAATGGGSAGAIDELIARYAGWNVTVETERGRGQVFLATKESRASVSH